MRLQCIKNESRFSKPYEPFGGDINVKVDLSNYATKTDLKNVTHDDTSRWALNKLVKTTQTIIHS